MFWSFLELCQNKALISPPIHFVPSVSQHFWTKGGQPELSQAEGKGLGFLSLE